MKSACLCFTLTLFLLASATPLLAVDAQQFDDFQDGTTQGWTSGGPNPNPPIHVPTGGPSGVADAFLRIEATGGNIPGGRMVGFNVSQWTGDYPASGITALVADVKNFSDEDMELRLTFENLDVGGAFSSTVGIPLVANSDWRTVTFPIGPSDLTSVGFADYPTTMSNVSRLRILHNTEPAVVGLEFAGTLGVDNIRTIPEPQTLLCAVLTTVLVGVSCRGKRNRNLPVAKL